MSLVARLLRRALRHPDCAASVRRRALEKLGLLLCQQPETQGRARRLLLRNSYQFRLSADVLCYPLMAPSECLPVPPQNLLSVTDDALPLGMLGQLQEALAPSSPFWGAHGYRCGTSPFFSYVHHLDEPPRCGFDRVLAVLHAHVCSAFPHAAHAKRAEWWAHCRPHGTGHQLHFDSDDEGRAGVRNPIVSCALYLTSGIGGPTLVTDQAIGSARLAQRGWATLPHTNRLLMFNGKFLHGVVRVPPPPLMSTSTTHHSCPGARLRTAARARTVACATARQIPGRGCVPTGDPSRRRITLMVAFWPTIRERTDPDPVAARPFPYATGQPSPHGWPAVFDWPEACDAKAGAGSSALPAARAARGGCAEAAPRMWCVEPVWQPLGEVTSASAMPSYDACFQGF